MSGNRVRLLPAAAGICAAALLALSPRAADAVVIGYTENFSANQANWQFSTTTQLDYIATGGQAGATDGYVSTSYAFSSASIGGTGAKFRAQDEFNSSAHAFEGNYLSPEITSVSLYVRHNVPENVGFSLRFSDPANFPGASTADFSVAPNTWTKLTVPILASSFVTFEGSDFNSIFDSIGHLQVSITRPASRATDDTIYKFDLDTVNVVPEPHAAGILGSAGLCLLGRRRRKTAAGA